MTCSSCLGQITTPPFMPPLDQVPVPDQPPNPDSDRGTIPPTDPNYRPPCASDVPGIICYIGESIKDLVRIFKGQSSYIPVRDPGYYSVLSSAYGSVRMSSWFFLVLVIFFALILFTGKRD